MKESSNLLVSKKEEKYANSLKKLEVTPFADGFLTTGNYFLIQNIQTNGFLVLDTDDKNSNYKNAFAVTTSKLMNFACPRSLFKIEKFQTSNQPETIYYGEKIMLLTHTESFANPLYLHSTLITPQSSSRFSRNQEVLVTDEKSYNCCWIIEHPDRTLRFSMEGRPVAVTDSIILRHCATGRLLASDNVDYYNDYGLEYEVCCNNFLTVNKYQTLVAEKSGQLKIDTKTKSEKEQNIWKIYDQ
jgi:dolichyl-phosphate-mannose--protein O-mannosyl transferase